MDWLKDKKNQPIIAIAAAVIIVGVGAFLFFARGSGDDSNAPVSNASGQMPTGMSRMPGAPGQIGTPGSPAGSAQPTAAAQPAQTADATDGATPMEPWRADPFLPVGYKPPATTNVARKMPIADFPFIKIPLPPKERPEDQVPDAIQPPRRMAGLLLNERVYAIIETNGVSEVVQPGDRLKDGLAVVEKIEQDKVVLKTTDKKPKYVVVRMAASPKTNITSADTSGRPPGVVGAPGVPMPGMSRMPRAPGRRGM